MGAVTPAMERLNVIVDPQPAKNVKPSRSLWSTSLKFKVLEPWSST